MPSLRRSKPKTVTDRIKTAGASAGDVGKAVGNVAKAAGEVVGEGAKTARDLAVTTTKNAPSTLETTKGKAAAAAAVGAAGAVAYWKKSQGDEPAVEFDPKAGEPTSHATTETPEAKAAKDAVSSANGDSS